MNVRLLLPLLVAPALGGELTIEKKPFRLEQTFTAQVVPAEPQVLTLEPESWQEFKIARIADHGTPVKAGEVVVAFERRDYDHRLNELKRSVAKKELELATRQLDFEKLKEEIALQVETARRAKAMADEDLAYFRETGRPAREAVLQERIKQSEFQLAAEKEELAQLTQMYEADDLTEETEEIILERQKFAVASAEFQLKEVKRQTENVLTITLPREAEKLEKASTEAAITLAKAEQNLPRSLKVAGLELEGASDALEFERRELARLEKDATLFEWKAGAAGTVFYGAFEQGVWKLGDLSKLLVKGGKAPLRRGLVSVLADGDSQDLQARLDGAVAMMLSRDLPLSITIPGRENLSLLGSVGAIDSLCGTDGKYGAAITVDWPDGFPVPPTTELSCTAVIYEKSDAIVVPLKSLSATNEGTWSIEVKLADGKAERRVVWRGRANKDEVEIVSGLVPGQVVLIAD